MAALSPTDAGVSSFTSKQLTNVIWKRGRIEVPPFVGLGVSKYSRKIYDEYYRVRLAAPAGSSTSRLAEPWTHQVTTSRPQAVAIHRTGF